MQDRKKVWILALTIVTGGLLFGVLPAFAVAAPGPAAGPAYGCNGGYGGGAGGYGMGMQQGFMAELAGFFKLDQNQFMQERHNGKSLLQLAQENGKSEQELREFLSSQHAAFLDQQVKAGRLTAEQKQAREAAWNANLTGFINNAGGYMHGGGGHGRGAGNCGGYWR